MKLFVGSLPYSFSEQELQDLFQEFGEVTSARIITDRETGRSRGFGFVEMSNKEEAKKAMEALHNKEVGGRKIVVNEALQKEGGRR